MKKHEPLYQKAVKISNTKKIFTLLRKKIRLTKQEISQHTGLSIPTVTSNVKSLIESGYVCEAEAEESTGGRPARAIQYLPNARFAIGVELKESSFRLILVNLDGIIIKKSHKQSLDQADILSSIQSETAYI